MKPLQIIAIIILPCALFFATLVWAINHPASFIITMVGIGCLCCVGCFCDKVGDDIV